MRPSAALTPLNLPILDPVTATATIPFSLTFTAFGGLPVYNWDIVAGTPPPGLTLDSFTGTLSGTPATNGTFSFTLRVRDYHEGGVGITRGFSLFVLPPPPVRLALAVVDVSTDGPVELLLTGTSGQRQVIQVSSDLVNWTPVATNSSGTNLYQFVDNHPRQFDRRFYRAVVVR